MRENWNLVKRIERAKREGRIDELRAELEAEKGSALAQRAGRLEDFTRSMELLNTMARPMRYEAVDGSGEIGIGAWLLCFALSSYANVWLSPWKGAGNLSLLLLFAGCLAIPLCRWVIKRYITWPRTGYVSYRHDRKFWVIIIASAVLAGIAGLLLPHLMEPEMKRWIEFDLRHGGLTRPGAIHTNTMPGALSSAGTTMLAVFMVCIPLMYLMTAGVSMGKHRWKWLVLLLIISGSVGMCIFVSGDFMAHWRPLVLFYALVFLMSGVATLISYVHHTQPPVAEVA